MRLFQTASLALATVAFLATSAFAQSTSGDYMFHLYKQADHSQTLYLFDADGKPLGPVSDKSGNLAWALDDPNNQGKSALDTQLVTAKVTKQADGSYTLDSFNGTYAKNLGNGTTGPATEGEFVGVKLGNADGGEDTRTSFKLASGHSVNDFNYAFTFGKTAPKPLAIAADAPVPSAAPKAPEAPKADKYMFHLFQAPDHSQTLYLYDANGKPLGPVNDKSGDLAWALGDPNNQGKDGLDSQLVTAKVVKESDGSYTVKSFDGTYTKLDDKGGTTGPTQSGEFVSVQIKKADGGEDSRTVFKLASGGTVDDFTYSLSFGEKATQPLQIPSDAPVPRPETKSSEGISRILERETDKSKDKDK